MERASGFIHAFSVQSYEFLKVAQDQQRFIIMRDNAPAGIMVEDVVQLIEVGPDGKRAQSQREPIKKRIIYVYRFGRGLQPGYVIAGLEAM